MNRFWSKVDKTGSCWLWLAGTTHYGYGVFHLDGRQQRAHRLTYKWLVGPIPDKLFVCHTCDNPPCVNPDHLFLGTQKENMQDCKTKNRLSLIAAKGQKAGGSKLTDFKVEAIRRYLEQGIGPRVVAKMFNVHRGTIGNIKARRSWSHI